jgi:hypothetical protein
MLRLSTATQLSVDESEDRVVSDSTFLWQPQMNQKTNLFLKWNHLDEIGEMG